MSYAENDDYGYQWSERSSDAFRCNWCFASSRISEDKKK